MAKCTEELKPNVFRIIFGIIVGYLVPAFALFFAILAKECFTIFTQNYNFILLIIGILATPIAVLSMFYLYGWMHKSLMAYAAHADSAMRFLGYIGGGIGYVLQPFVLLIYGANKKWLYFFTVGLPCLLGGGIFLLNHFNIIPFDAQFSMLGFDISLHDYSLFFAIALFLNAFLALLTKRCPRCGAMMTEIEHSLDDITYDRYARYDGVDWYGDKAVIGKYYVCRNCCHVKKGVGFEVQTDSVI